MQDPEPTGSSGATSDGDSPFELIDDLLVRFDGDAKFDTGSLSAWSGELRLTLSDPPSAPARSIAFFTAGAADPVDAAWTLLAEVRGWLETSGVEPMPVPDWMREDR